MRHPRTSLAVVVGVVLATAVVVAVVVVVVRTLLAGSATSAGQSCVSGTAQARWELTLGEADLYGDEGLVDAAGLEDGTVVVGAGATGADGSDVQGETVFRLLGVRDGEEVWSRDDLSLVTATEDGEGVLAVDGDGTLLRLDAEGEEVWAVDGALARHEHDGRLVVETDDQTRTAVLDVATGEVLTEVPGRYADASGDRLLVGTESADGVSLVGLDGSEEWTVYPGDLDVGDGIAGVLNGDLAVVGETAALPTVVGLDARSGEEAWRVTEELDDGALAFTGPGPEGTVALDQAGEDGFETFLVDLSGEVAREQVLTRTVYVDGETLLLDRDDEAGVRLLGAGLEEVASYDGVPVTPCGDGIYLADGEDLVVVDWESGDEQGRVEGVVDPDGDPGSLAVLGGGVLVETETDAGTVVTLYD